MEEVKTDVIVAPSPTQEVEQQEASTTETVQPTPPALQSGNTDVDEIGVPWKNRAMEYQRKYEKAVEKLEQTAQPQPVQHQYTAAQLKAFAAAPDVDPAHRQWALDEMSKLEKDEYANIVRGELTKFKQEQEIHNTKAKVFQSVINRNPDIITTDAKGNFTGWNMKNEKLQLINQYMTNPEIGNHPRGLEIAEAFAIRDLSGKVKQTQQQMKAEIGDLKKKTLVEGGGQKAESVAPYLQAIEKSKSGKPKDAIDAWRMVKAK